MSKRSGYFQLKEPFAAKKPKLDLEIIPSQQYKPQPSTSTSNTSAKVAVENEALNLWDDDDDEIILRATQAVEADITFGKFSRSVSSSTQMLLEAHSSHNMTKPQDKLFAELLDVPMSQKDDEYNYPAKGNKIDELFIQEFNEDFNLKQYELIEQIPPNRSRIDPPKATVEFKAPAPVFKPYTTDIATSHAIKREETPSTSGLAFKPKTATVPSQSFKLSLPKATPSSSAKTEQEAKDSASIKQDRAKDIQVKFLTKHVQDLDKKVENLQKDYREAFDKLQVKDGEVSMLRYELKMVKGTNDQLRLEKISEKETISKEWLEKIKDLEKIIMAQKAELDFKDMEVMNLKTKRLNSSIRVAEQQSKSVDAKSAPVELEAPDKKANNAPSFILSDALSKLSFDDRMDDIDRFEIDPQAFSISPDGAVHDGRKSRKFSKLSRTESLISEHLISLQTYLSQMVSNVMTSGSNSPMRLSAEMLPKVVLATEKGLNEVIQYCQRLGQQKEHAASQCSAGQLVERTAEGCSTSRIDHSCAMNIFQPDKLFVGEQAIVMRRFLALVAIFCRCSADLVTNHLLKSGQILQLANSFKCISITSVPYELHGVITAAATLLNGIIFRGRLLKTFGENGSQLMELFRSIVVCQTDAPSSLVELSQFLCQLSAYAQDGSVLELLNLLCYGHLPTGQSDSKRLYRMKSISFSKETCTLQMFAALLESSVRQHVTYERWQLKPLLANAEYTINFLRNSLFRPSNWVKLFLYKDDPTGCDLCHIRMVSAFIKLFHRVLLCWNQQTVWEEQDIARVHGIAQNGLLLMYDLFQTAYRKKLLLFCSHEVRYRLRISYDWLKMYEKDFRFQHVHSTTLGLLDMRLLMSDPLRINLENESKQQDEENKPCGRVANSGELTTQGAVG
ncbi:uncharacterized protein LOC128724003 [Anopheles nili]|uniref:uncharacterized protein LOC128724003 n=1 Tax=Anopheles nili TaxID=185578 RepID=UPI00237C0E27|nr:uncharacterized protein LOC128724003 [Anopheles nili]